MHENAADFVCERRMRHAAGLWGVYITSSAAAAVDNLFASQIGNQLQTRLRENLIDLLPAGEKAGQALSIYNLYRYCDLRGTCEYLESFKKAFNMGTPVGSTRPGDTLSL